MAQRSVSRSILQQTVNALADANGNQAEAATKLGAKLTTFKHRVQLAKAGGVAPIGRRANDPKVLQFEVKRLRAELKRAQEKELSEEVIRRSIISLAKNAAETSAPAWLAKPARKPSAPGVPTLFLSDLHWGEVVKPAQINGVNEYNVAIAHKRIDTLAESAVQLLRILNPAMDYPGLVLLLGGDMISGNIHEELAATNEINTMPTVLDLFGKLASFIKGMADQFGAVFVPCVTGNHGRNTRKTWNKDRHHTSFDWLLYCFLAKHFEHDKRITFQIPDSSAAYFKIYGYRYWLEHGDQFKGGDGVIGSLGPIIRGDHRKRSRNAQVDMEYDTMLLGHWHQYMHLTRLIVNGSLKGYDEYAFNNSFPFERPQQALWLTHPKYGITYRMPVYVDKQRAAPKTTWVSVPQ